ncbi:MAG: zinc ribbon domain-containing protein [Burkholderiales bacterium]|nr:zinc ribbon domain-containing protein [Burkholderiales bacterium]
MPIYAYKCRFCGHQQDILQKISEDPLTVCPQCNQPSFAKQVTAAGFQLKGSGWYVTDFRDNGAKRDSKSADKPAEIVADPATAKTDAKADAKTEAASSTGSTAGTSTSASTGTSSSGTTPASGGSGQPSP